MKFFKWIAIVLAVLISVGGIAIFLNKILFSEKEKEVVEKLTPEQQAIISTDFELKESIKADELDTKEHVITMIHEMANTKIIAVDDMRWGLKPITKDRVEAAQRAVKNMGINDEKIDDMLNRWSKQDFSKCVEEHNYIWKYYLHGTVGKAKALRKLE